MKNNKKKTIVVSIRGRLVKRTASRHYWLYDGKKWVRLGLTHIADELGVGVDVIKGVIVEANTEKPVTGFKYWVDKVVDSVDITILNFVAIIVEALMMMVYGTDNNNIIAVCAVVNTLLFITTLKGVAPLETTL